MILLRPHFRLSKIQVDLKQHLAALDEENSFYSLGDGRPGKKQSGISNKQVAYNLADCHCMMGQSNFANRLNSFLCVGRSTSDRTYWTLHHAEIAGGQSAHKSIRLRAEEVKEEEWNSKRTHSFYSWQSIADNGDGCETDQISHSLLVFCFFCLLSSVLPDGLATWDASLDAEIPQKKMYWSFPDNFFLYRTNWWPTLFVDKFVHKCYFLYI